MGRIRLLPCNFLVIAGKLIYYTEQIYYIGNKRIKFPSFRRMLESILRDWMPDQVRHDNLSSIELPK